MPHFIIYGGMKCGTTSLWEYLGEHPDVLHIKDDHFFFPEDIREKMERQVSLLTQKEKKWLYRDIEFRDLTDEQLKLLPKKILPPKKTLNKEASKIKRNFKKLMRPIIGAKEIRWFGPSTFKWATYFSEKFTDQLLWYLQAFPTIPKHRGSKFDENYGKITGEASPTYMHGNSIILKRIKYFFPDIRIIILLRNPVERFLSMQRMKNGMQSAVQNSRLAEGKEIRDKETMTLDGLVEISDCGPYSDEDVEPVAKGKLKKINKDLKGSLYKDKIAEVLRTFDSDQVLVIQSEYFYSDTPAVMSSIEDFLGLSHLGLDKWGEITKNVYNLVMDGKNRTFTPQIGKQKNTISASNNTLALLEKYFADSNEELAEILEMRFEGWSYPDNLKWQNYLSELHDPDESEDEVPFAP